MHTIYLDGRMIQKNAEGYQYIQDMLQCPEYFGKNLDALFDVLTEIGGSKTIVIDHSDAMDKILKKVFINASDENECLNIILTNEKTLG